MEINNIIYICCGSPSHIQWLFTFFSCTLSMLRTFLCLIFDQNSVYTMDLRSAHKTPEKPLPYLRLSLTPSLASDDEEQRDGTCELEQDQRKGREEHKCLHSQSPTPEDWLGGDEEEACLTETTEKSGDDLNGKCPGPSRWGGGVPAFMEQWQEKCGNILDSNIQQFEVQVFCVPPSGQDRTNNQSSSIRPDEVLESQDSDDVWRPATGPAQVTVTDVTLNSHTVTFRESRMTNGFFRDWGLEVWWGGAACERVLASSSSLVNGKFTCTESLFTFSCLPLNSTSRLWLCCRRRSEFCLVCSS